ncbi:sulfate adenylyltransferase subunit 1 [Mycobacteroides abscessus subsp. bolletii]|uniref:sulfate adenylyltransferase n=1 Tax=Mycobacteroides abscessus subsp. bolletii TaxID=319705 RepID=A0A9Q7SD21_9MYCO|nr:GTP-binding protein [Mycobacteroides abscessus]SHU27491.1 sulfate adenylyltransferase subunit 1 [Mycobacteroides abscessus subsp. bolletii]SHV24709.1 sulfate adenylyltransferase subunit 1 [Mycobacteroides abscessus subsp. bolletii]SHX19330.1 sulfate adenylyltransferase subunit 1 [Mycobacteroides abscessus subsp. bolletii]SKL39933.1 sulfate adenylyltransferase subunit 1 [Mycobacteroides abscessus subsp. bolletii]SKM65568.1 sulfate adenylyltransferase subunit 1 [Mycobacteroides abscessus subs
MSDLLRIATAGSVDDGKSTLVGRLLYDTKSVLIDQFDAVTKASESRGLDAPDLSLLVDGLRAEREQGITIDVAYRYFATPKRSFILADTPGHVQYTRNTVSGASTAQLVILLVDARKGVIEQTRRHAAVLALLGVPRLVLAVNKIDLVPDSARIFEAISAEFNELTSSLGWKPENVVEIPVSALHGDNIATPSERTGFYNGPTLIEHLESVPAHGESDGASGTIGLRFPVQYVIRPRTAEYPDYRGYAGQVAAGAVRVGDEVVISPAGRRTTIAGIDTADGPLEVAEAGRSITLILADDVDASRGDLIASPDVPDPVSELDGTVCWLADKPLKAGARLLLKHGTRTVPAIIGALVERFDEQNLSADPAPESLELNDIGQISIRLAEAISVDEYVDDRTAGSFLLIDPSSGNTLAAGLVGNALRAVELNRA